MIAFCSAWTMNKRLIISGLGSPFTIRYLPQADRNALSYASIW